MYRFLFFILSIFSFSAYGKAPPPCCEKSITIHPTTGIHSYIEEPIQGEEHLIDFHHELLCLLDQQQNLFLFRGNLPEKKKAFEHDALVSAIKAYIAKEGGHIQDNFKIMDLSFLNNLQEHEAIEIEKDWFTIHPETGCFWLHPLYGALINPLDLDTKVRDAIARDHDTDGLKTLMAHLGKIIQAPCSSDFVLYMHCRAGKDRTGEASACYLMQYKGYSYKQAIQFDEEIAKRKLSFLSMNAIRWYAFYLRDIKNMTTIGDIDGK